MDDEWPLSSEEMYTTLRSHLLERVRDKESFIRVQSIIALSKLAGSEDPEEYDDEEVSIIDILVDTLKHDTSP